MNHPVYILIKVHARRERIISLALIEQIMIVKINQKITNEGKYVCYKEIQILFNG